MVETLDFLKALELGNNVSEARLDCTEDADSE